jgi:hypothetical protein
VEGHVTVRFCDEFDGGFGRIVDDESLSAFDLRQPPNRPFAQAGWLIPHGSGE